MRGTMGMGGLWLGQRWYKIDVPDLGMVMRAVNEADLATNYRGLDKLVRSRWAKVMLQTGTSFDRPLGFIRYLLGRGHPWVQDTFERVVDLCQTVMGSPLGRRCLATDRGDDLMRKTLALCEESIGAAGAIPKVLFSGMSTLGGPRGWQKDAVVESVRDWVSGEATLFHRPGDAAFARSVVDRWMVSWVGQGLKYDCRNLGFEGYKKDFMRWGTSGGCSPTSTEIDYAIRTGLIKNKSQAGALRTKTICGTLSVLAGDTDSLLRRTNVCHAALKEEAKTRVIISTPMWSYVRMCYVLECLGKPLFLNSTLSRHDMVVRFTQLYSMHYAAVDASKFDHNVPLWLLKHLWTSLANALEARFGAGEELVVICRELLDELDDLWVEVLGVKIRYEKGLLSGWRVTSLFGSVISALCCELYIDFATHNLNVPRETVGYLTQGDDVILWSCVDTFSHVIGYMQEIGVRTHHSKCLVGEDGDFLRSLYTRAGKIGYPMRSLRGLFYAHPWIERRQYQGLAEISSNWLQAASRVQMWRREPDGELFSLMLREAASDIARWGCGLRSSQVLALLRTPTALGGLGCVETDTGGPYVCYKALSADKQHGRAFSDFLDFVGIKPDGGYTPKLVEQAYVDMVAVNAAATKLNPWDANPVAPLRGVNRAGLLLYIVKKTSTSRERALGMFADVSRRSEELLSDEGRMVVDRLSAGMYGRTTRRAELLRVMFGDNPMGLVTSISLDLTAAREKMRWAEDIAKLCLKGMAHRVSKTKEVAASWTVYLAMMRTDATFGQL
nr:MAG: RNA-dependent RNA polymerase [Totiviridae sp.]